MSIKLAISIGMTFRNTIIGISSNFLPVFIPFIARKVRIKAPALGRDSISPRLRKLVLTSSMNMLLSVLMLMDKLTLIKPKREMKQFIKMNSSIFEFERKDLEF